MAAWCRETAAPPVAEENLYIAGLWGLASRPPEGEGAPSLYPPSYESEWSWCWGDAGAWSACALRPLAALSVAAAVCVMSSAA